MYNERKHRASALPAVKRRDMPVKRSKTENESPIINKIILSSLLGAGANALIGIILVSIVTLIAYRSPDPLSMIPTLALLALLPSNFLGGFIASKKCGEAPFVCGLVSGAIWGMAALIMSLCMYSSESSGYSLWQGLLLHSASVLFCVLGALTGGIKRRPSKNKHRFG